MGQLNPILLGAAAAIGLALILIIVGLATPNWISYGSGHSGLFKTCNAFACADYDDYPSLPSELVATRAMVILGFIGAFLATLSCTALIVSGFTEALKSVVGYLPLATLISAVAGGAFTIIGCIIYGATYFIGVIDPDFSFILSLIGAIILIVGGIIAFKGGKRALEAA